MIFQSYAALPRGPSFPLCFLFCASPLFHVFDLNQALFTSRFLEKAPFLYD